MSAQPTAQQRLDALTAALRAMSDDEAHERAMAASLREQSRHMPGIERFAMLADEHERRADALHEDATAILWLQRMAESDAISARIGRRAA